MPAFNPEATLAYMRSIAGGGKTLEALTPEFIAEIEALREEIRIENDGGGMCHLVTEALQAKYGWERLYVSYLTMEGEIICGGGHVISVLPDGAILDPTRDQFGEGYSVSLIAANSPELGRYRPEFYDDFHPAHPDAAGQLDGWKDIYDGRQDYDVEASIVGERGANWWLTDMTQMNAYRAKQSEYAQGNMLVGR